MTSSTLPSHLSGLVSLVEKDLSNEQLLAVLNDVLAAVEADIEASFTGPVRPPVFILGAPRTGTTMFSQLLAATGAFGITRNFAARFWKAPALGMMIEKALGFDKSNDSDSLQSTRGRTSGWSGPNEFGYFWSRFFDFGQDVHVLPEALRSRFDGAGLNKAVAAMESVQRAPMAFKNNTWFCSQADLLAETFPGCVIVNCSRDPFFSAQSLWFQRITVHGSPETWWSMKPADYASIASRPPIEQVALQAASISKATERAVKNARGATVIDAPYARVGTNPRTVVAEVLAACGLATSQAQSLPAVLTTTDTVKLPPNLADQLRQALALVE